MLPHLIYGLVDPRSGAVRYVGKSSSGLGRPERHRLPCLRKENTAKNRWLRDLAAHGIDFEIVVLEEVTDPHASSGRCWWRFGHDSHALDDAECWWIAFWRAHSSEPLTNETDGGDGGHGHGYRPTAETRKALSQITKGLWQDSTFRERVLAARRTPAVQARVAATWTSERLARDHNVLSAAARKRWASPEFRANRKQRQPKPPPKPLQVPYPDGTSAVMEALGIRSKQGVWYYDDVLRPTIENGRRVYDMAAVLAFAASRKKSC